MAIKSNLYAAIAGYVGRADQKGAVGVFSRQAETGQWEHVIDGFEAWAVEIHPKNPNIVFAGTADGVYRSTDKGKSFHRMNFPDKGIQVWSFLFDRTDPNTIYAGGSPITVFRSDDGGQNWKRLTDPGLADPAPNMPFACRVMRMAQHPTKPKTIYAALEVNGCIRTDDGGETWVNCSEDLVRLSSQPNLKSKILTDSFAEGMLDGHAIAISSADPDKVILAVRMGLFESTDKGKTWQDMEVGRFSPTTYGRDIRVSPADPNVLYSALSVAAASKDGGVYRSTDKGQTWNRFDKVQVHGTVMSIALNRNDPNSVFVGARYDGEIYGTEDGGHTWESVNLPGTVKDIYCLAAG